MIILDTDFLINSIKFKIDVISQIKENHPKKEIAIIDKTLDELKNLNSLNSKTAINLIKNKKIKIIKTKKDKIVDDLILEYVKKEDLIATQDKKLKKRLKEKNIEIITIRQKKYINTKL